MLSIIIPYIGAELNVNDSALDADCAPGLQISKVNTPGSLCYPGVVDVSMAVAASLEGK